MAKVSRKKRTWRRQQKRGAIMQPSTFKRIKEEAKRRYGVGEERAKRIAGKAYWRTVESKYRKSQRKRRSSRRSRRK